MNQFDQEERSSQVGYMNEIYDKAAAVCIWLGLPEDDTEHAIQTIDTWSACIGPVDTASEANLLPAIWQKSRQTDVRKLLTDALSSQRTWAAIHDLASRTWWERTWVIQEATGPAPNYTMCGRFWIPFLDLLKALLVADPITKFPGLPFLPLESRHFYPMFMTLNFVNVASFGYWTRSTSAGLSNVKTCATRFTPFSRPFSQVKSRSDIDPFGDSKTKELIDAWKKCFWEKLERNSWVNIDMFLTVGKTFFVGSLFILNFD
ncbi:hypothetical protein Vi05172_g4622 [Venturia inaequalis]|nr:hypothetical protein Vi05172_g4622 [Venturia inaequalis]